MNYSYHSCIWLFSFSIAKYVYCFRCQELKIVPRLNLEYASVLNFADIYLICIQTNLEYLIWKKMQQVVLTPHPMLLVIFHLWFYHQWYYCTFCTPYNIFLRKYKISFNGRVVSMTENEYFSAVLIPYSLLSSSKSILDEWLVTIFWSYRLFWIFMIWSAFNVRWFTSSKFLKLSFVWNLHDLKYSCIINTEEILNFLSLIKGLVTTGQSVLLLTISVIISSNTIKTFCSFPELHSWILVLTSFILIDKIFW